MHCKNCRKKNVIKNGQVRNQQRYRCKDCGYNFIKGDRRVKRDTAIKRAFAVILYSVGKASYGFIAKLFGVTRPAVQKWLEREAATLCARLSLTRCGILSGQKKQKMDPQSGGSRYR